jgi:hypothetical protein
MRRGGKARVRPPCGHKGALKGSARRSWIPRGRVVADTPSRCRLILLPFRPEYVNRNSG